MSEHYKTVVRLIPKLTPAERSQIMAAIKSCDSISGGSAIKHEITDVVEFSDKDDADLILFSIRSVVFEHGVESPSIKMMKGSSVYSSFCDKVIGLESWIEKAADTKNKKRAFLKMAVKLLYDDLTKNGIPTKWDDKNGYLRRANRKVGSRELMIYIHLLPSVVDKQFPGYMRNGVLSWIIRQEGKRNARSKQNNKTVSQR